MKTQYNKIFGTEKFCLLYQIFCYISSKKTQYKTKEINSLGPEKLFCYIRYSILSYQDLFTSSFHCTKEVISIDEYELLYIL